MLADVLSPEPSVRAKARGRFEPEHVAKVLADILSPEPSSVRAKARSRFEPEHEAKVLADVLSPEPSVRAKARGRFELKWPKARSFVSLLLTSLRMFLPLLSHSRCDQF